jgi:hypothetical protein
VTQDDGRLLAGAPARDARARHARVVRTAVALLALAWSGWAFAHNLGHQLAHWRRRAEDIAAPSAYWRFGMPPVEALRRCTNTASRVLPQDAVVVLADPQRDFFRSRWTAYFLVGQQVVTEPTPEAFAVLAWTRAARPNGGEPLVARRHCFVDRVR